MSVLLCKVRSMSYRRFRSAPGGVCSRVLHLVWCPTHRRGVLGGRVAVGCGELREQVSGKHGYQVVAREMLPDHMHLFVRVGPTDVPAQMERAFKGRTARVLRAEFRHPCRFAKVLWSPSYVAASVGYVSESTVRRCTEHHLDAVAS